MRNPLRYLIRGGARWSDERDGTRSWRGQIIVWRFQLSYAVFRHSNFADDELPARWVFRPQVTYDPLYYNRKHVRRNQGADT